MESLNDLLNWFVSSDGGAFLWVAGFLSWAFEKAAWFQNLKIKLFTIVVTTGLLGGLAAWLQMNPDVVTLIDPFVRPLMYAIVAVSGSQVAHAINPFRKKE